VARNAVSQEVVEIERAGGAKFEDIKHLVAGVRGREALQTGETDDGIWSAGMIQGLIHDVPTVEELVHRIVTEAEDIIRGRLAGMLSEKAMAAE
jgi:nitronate monooxygenase